MAIAGEGIRVDRIASGYRALVSSRNGTQFDLATAIRPSRGLRYGGPTALVVAVGLYVAEFTHWPAYLTQIDVMVYRFGGQRVLGGLDLYSTGIFGSHRVLLFTYTPFAALCFTPLNMVSLPWLRALSLAAAAALLTYTVRRALTASGMPRHPQWWTLTALLVGLCLWLEPVRYSIQLGQINLIILAVVVADLLGSPERKWAGLGIGLVAGVKLTPAIFLIYLVLIGRRRAALVGTAAFLATIAVGFAVLPGDSATYWLGGKFDDPQRVSPDPAVSASVRGLFLRLHYPAAAATAVALTLALLCLAVAVLACRRGHPVLGLSLTGLASAAASPFSWSHHWVWFVPLIVHLGHRGYRPRVEVGAVRGMGAVRAHRGMADLAARQGADARLGGLAPRRTLECVAAQRLSACVARRGTRIGGLAAAVKYPIRIPHRSTCPAARRHHSPTRRPCRRVLAPPDGFAKNAVLQADPLTQHHSQTRTRRGVGGDPGAVTRRGGPRSPPPAHRRCSCLHRRPAARTPAPAQRVGPRGPTACHHRNWRPCPRAWWPVSRESRSARARHC